MEKAVSAADANRKFSKLLSAVRGGQSYVVTARQSGGQNCTCRKEWGRCASRPGGLVEKTPV